jgi:putative DNA primase/helicase
MTTTTGQDSDRTTETRNGTRARGAARKNTQEDETPVPFTTVPDKVAALSDAATTIPPQRDESTEAADLGAFEAFRREKARKEKTQKALEAADEKERAEFLAWKAEKAQEGAKKEAAARTPPQPERKPRDSSKLVPSPADPMAVVRHLQPAWERDGVLILRHWRGAWWRWSGSYWAEYDDADMRGWLYRRMEHAEYLFVDGRSGIESERRWAPSKGKIANLVEAAQAVTLLPTSTEMPGWTDGRPDSGSLIIPCRNGLLDLGTRRLLQPSPLYFNGSAAPFDYDARAPQPSRWLAFLESIWPDDPEAIAALREVMGYIVSGRRDLHKIFLLVGPTRSGKGTIAAVLTALIGEAHTAGPTLARFSEMFGLQDMIGKSLAIVPDARMPRDGVGTIVENLLMISGQDSITIPRKHRDAWTGRLPIQLVLMSNELPTLPDSAAAVAGRLFTLRMTQSFYGREDLGLLPALMAELPGIFNWALGGLDQLAKRGRLIEPTSSAEAVALLREKSSPAKEFLTEMCVLEPTAVVTEDDLWTAWQKWHVANNYDHVGRKIRMREQMFSAAPAVRRTRPRVEDGMPRPYVYEGLRLI